METKVKDGINMSYRKILISEPWGFINPKTNSNSIIFIHENQVQYMGEKIDLVRVVEPFDYLGLLVEMLILVPRYQEGKSHKTFNVLHIDEIGSNNVIETAKFLFIGSLD
jgi:hypothetical protein